MTSLAPDSSGIDPGWGPSRLPKDPIVWFHAQTVSSGRSPVISIVPTVQTESTHTTFFLCTTLVDSAQLLSLGHADFPAPIKFKVPSWMCFAKTDHVHAGFSMPVKLKVPSWSCLAITTSTSLPASQCRADSKCPQLQSALLRTCNRHQR